MRVHKYQLKWANFQYITFPDDYFKPFVLYTLPTDVRNRYVKLIDWNRSRVFLVIKTLIIYRRKEKSPNVLTSLNGAEHFNVKRIQSAADEYFKPFITVPTLTVIIIIIIIYIYVIILYIHVSYVDLINEHFSRSQNTKRKQGKHYYYVFAEQSYYTSVDDVQGAFVNTYTIYAGYCLKDHDISIQILLRLLSLRIRTRTRHVYRAFTMILYGGII